ncbi:tetratricopeptide repeat protein [Paenibacillus glucanolyticus]|uniref:tetratricopeptide repeat protein n=1 Tax=Paenibacillus glucanolyticus TaxID=59843 RepID=UPI00368DDEAF
MSTIQTAIELRSAGKPEEAKQILLGLLEQSPEDPDILYQLAWVHDLMGLEGEAVPYYEKAISSGLKDPERRGALLGLGSTYRTLGLYNKSKEIFERGRQDYPQAREFNVFYAMTLHNLGQYDKAMELLLKELGETSSDEGIHRYQRAIVFYSDKLNQVWE